MRLVIMGQQVFGRDVLARVLDAGMDEVVAVYCEPDRPGGKVDPIKELALERGIEVRQPADHSGTAVQSAMATLHPDLMVMAFVNLFVPATVRDTPRLGSICFHPSLLPLHRGPSAVNWPIIMGSTRSGYSWFFPTDGLDEGDILYQWECDLGPDDTVIDLYFKKIYPHAVEGVLGVINMFRGGAPERRRQDEAQATYERRCTKRHARIDWHKPVDQVYNLVRGTNPAPGAWTEWGDATLDIFDCRKVPGDGISGRVRRVNDDGFEVQCVGGRILVQRVRPSGGAKGPAGEWARAVGLAPGQALGS